GGDYRADSGEMRGVSDGGEHLRRADVGPANHADFAVGIRQGGDPLDGVVPVLDFVPEGIPLAFGGVATANVLHTDNVAVSGELIAGRDSPAGALVVGSAHEDNGE